MQWSPLGLIFKYVFLAVLAFFIAALLEGVQ